MTQREPEWWDGVSAQAEDPDLLRDPWADRPLFVAGLTNDQRAVLAGLDDQPPMPTIDGLEGVDSGDQPAIPRLRPGNGTGSAPGDTEGLHPYRPNAWKEVDQ